MDIVLLSVRAGVAGRGIETTFSGNLALYNRAFEEMQFSARQMTFV